VPFTPVALARRDALRVLAASLLAGTGVAGLAPAVACRRAAPPAPPPAPTTGAPAAAGANPSPPKGDPLRLPLRDVPVGERTNIVYGDAPVELQRTGGGIEARLLLCTHFGCPVSWNGEAARYECPCHGGAFDAAGEPIAGPPTRSLLRVPARVAADAVIVGGAEG
jgi:Rieske Fe-S protein